MIRLTSALLALAVLVAPTGAQGRPADTSDIPATQRPPAGMCRIWIDGVPAERQPAPTDCATAIRRRPANARVIFGDETRAHRPGLREEPPTNDQPPVGDRQPPLPGAPTPLPGVKNLVPDSPAEPRPAPPPPRVTRSTKEVHPQPPPPAPPPHPDKGARVRRTAPPAFHLRTLGRHP